MAQLNLPGLIIAGIIIVAVLAGSLFLIPVFINLGEIDEIEIDETAMENTQENIDTLIEDTTENLFLDKIISLTFGLGIAAVSGVFSWLIISSRPSKTNIILGAALAGLAIITLIIVIITVLA